MGMPTVLITSPVFITRAIKPMAKLEADGWTVRDEPAGTHADADQRAELLDGVDATHDPFSRMSQELRVERKASRGAKTGGVQMYPHRHQAKESERRPVAS